MKCPNCDKEIEENSNTCKFCDKNVTTDIGSPIEKGNKKLEYWQIKAIAISIGIASCIVVFLVFLLLGTIFKSYSFIITPIGLIFSIAAYFIGYNVYLSNLSGENEETYIKGNREKSRNKNNYSYERKCSHCGSTNLQYQAVSEREGVGCGMWLLYIFLFITILGWLVLIPILINHRHRTHTYAVCQKCGHRWSID